MVSVADASFKPEERIRMLEQENARLRDTARQAQYNAEVLAGENKKLLSDLRSYQSAMKIIGEANKEGEQQALERAIDRMGWPEIRAFQDQLREGQDAFEDAGGFWLRAIKALFGIHPIDPVTNHQNAARALFEAASKESGRGE
jgi:hypothetical protein